MAGFKQGNKGTGAGVTSMTVAFLGACAAGNFIGATMQTPNTTGATISDNVNAGNYSVGNNHSTANNANDLGLWYKENILSGTPTVTFTPGGAGNVGASIGEYTGVLTASSIDKNGATEVTSNTTITSTSLTNTGANGDLILLAFSSQTQNVTVSNSTSGWNLDENNSPNATMNAVLGSDVQAVAGAFTTTTTVSGSAQDLCVIVVSFKLAAVASGVALFGFGPGLFSSPAPSNPAGIFLPFNPFVVISTGPVSNVVTATDNLPSMSDTATRVVSLPRSISDNLAAISDTATELLSLVRTAIDTLGSISDTATRAAQPFIRTATDSLPAISDTATRLLSLVRTATDNLASISDTPTRSAQSFIRTASDALGSLSDTATRAAQPFIRTATDNLSSLSETVTRTAQGFIRTATDNLPSMSDIATGIKVILRTATDSLGSMSDTATRGAQAFSRTATDNLSALSETVNKISSFVRTATDNLPSLSETATAIKVIIRTATDGLAAISDTAARIVGQPRTITDNLSAISDTATRAPQSFIRTAIDTLSSIADTAFNNSAVPLFFATAEWFTRDGSLLTKMRDGSLKLFGRDGSNKSKTRG